MEKQRWEETVRRREGGTKPDKRKSEKKEDAGARKGRKVVQHIATPCLYIHVFVGAESLKSSLAKAVGAEHW